MARAAIAGLGDIASVAEETSSWPYQHDRDLTGFIDGTENPTLVDAPEVALIPDGTPGSGGTILLLQKWVHDAAAWESLPVDGAGAGRSAGGSWTARSSRTSRPTRTSRSTDQDAFGKIFRRNMPYGTVTDHGTMFVGFSAEQRRLATMLESMAGLDDGTRDALTLYTRPLTGAYYFVPSIDGIRASGESV